MGTKSPIRIWEKKGCDLTKKKSFLRPRCKITVKNIIIRWGKVVKD